MVIFDFLGNLTVPSANSLFGVFMQPHADF